MSFNRLHEDYSPFFADAVKKKDDRVIFMAIDAEWHVVGSRNVVLSYQIATASQAGTNNIIKYMEHGQRLKLAEIVELGIRSVTPSDVFETFRGGKTRVVLVSHNFAAEWSVLADRDEPYITKRLSIVRKSPITDGHSIKLVLNKAIPVDVQFFDTMLLAPASHKALKKLSALLGSKDQEKETITQFYIEHMDLYLRDHPEKFRKYALKDTEITLRLFFLLQQALNDLVSGKFRLYRTLASAGVRAFLENNDWFKDYHKILRGAKYAGLYPFIKCSYFGGRNEGYFVGRTELYPGTCYVIYLDIDFTGCYPTAMSLCPKIDLKGYVDNIRLQYRIDDHLSTRMETENIPPRLIAAARKALDVSPAEFDKFLAGLSSKNMAWQIRSLATVVDNRLIDKWYGDWNDKVLVPGFARVRFRFPVGTVYPCLHVKDEKYGLIYPLEGETIATASEICLAMEVGAEIQALSSLELPIEKDQDGVPVRLVMDYLAELARARSVYKNDEDNPKSQVYDKLLKEFMNSFYGKFCQAINSDNVFRPSTAEEVPLGESPLTEPCTAALITSLARAALSSVLCAIERFNKDKDLLGQVTVISATTDGLLVGIPVPAGFSVMGDYYEFVEGVPKLKKNVDKQLNEILRRFGCGDLVAAIEAFLPIRQMRNSRLEMTGSDEIFEIKHMADKVVSVKTRGQIGQLETGEVTLLARFGHKVPLSEIFDDPEEYKRVMEAGGVVRDTADAEWLLDCLERIENGRDEIDSYNSISLTSTRKMLESKGELDLIKCVTPKKINLDYDYKRKLLRAEGEDSHPQIIPFTVPHKNLAEMRQYRLQMEAIRKTGRVARPEMVIHRVAVKGRTTRISGGEPATVTRQFIRGVTQGKILLKEKIPPYHVFAEKLNIHALQRPDLSSRDTKTWSCNDIKNAKRGAWEPGCILPNGSLEALVEELALTFGADPLQAKAAIFALEEFAEAHAVLIEQVVTAIAQAPMMGIEPFVSLFAQGYLPCKQKIQDAFRQHLSTEQIEAYFLRAFIPGQRPAGDVKKLKRLFYFLGIPSVKAEACAKCIAPPMPVKKSQRCNPGKKRCSEHFLLALLQPDINIIGVDLRRVLEQLKQYGLTMPRVHQLRNAKFCPNSLRNTPENRHQVRNMARSLGLDPRPYFEVLIEK